MGDGRKYDWVISLRAVETIDFMTAHWAHLPYDLLGKVSNRIINEVKWHFPTWCMTSAENPQQLSSGNNLNQFKGQIILPFSSFITTTFLFKIHYGYRIFTRY